MPGLLDGLLGDLVRRGHEVAPAAVLADEHDPGAALADVGELALGPPCALAKALICWASLAAARSAWRPAGRRGRVNLLGVCHDQDATDG